MADTGAFDILGNDNAEAGLASVVWGARKIPYIGVCPVNHPGVEPIKVIWRGSNALPHWSYKGCDGNDAEVEVYADAAEIELFVNNKSVGKSKTKYKKAVFYTTYEAGTLRAVAYDAQGNEISQSCLISAEGETNIRILPEGEVKIGEILYIDIDLVGVNGEIECNADERLTVSVEGGTLLGFGSANPRTEENFLTGSYRNYYVRSQTVILVENKKVSVTVRGENLGKRHGTTSIE